MYPSYRRIVVRIQRLVTCMCVNLEWEKIGCYFDKWVNVDEPSHRPHVSHLKKTADANRTNDRTSEWMNERILLMVRGSDVLISYVI